MQSLVAVSAFVFQLSREAWRWPLQSSPPPPGQGVGKWATQPSYERQPPCQRHSAHRGTAECKVEQTVRLLARGDGDDQWVTQRLCPTGILDAGHNTGRVFNVCIGFSRVS